MNDKEKLKEFVNEMFDGAGVSLCDCVVDDMDGMYDVWMEFFSPLGEDFSFDLYVNKKCPIESFVHEIYQYASDFDVDEHAAELIDIRGMYGTPDSVLALAKDAIEIRDEPFSLSESARNLFRDSTKKVDSRD